MDVGVGGTAISCQALEAGDLLAYVEDWRRRRNRDRTPKEREADLIQIRRAIDLQELEFAETAAAFADDLGDDDSEAADFIRPRMQDGDRLDLDEPGRWSTAGPATSESGRR